jgi:hypothetical protein
MSAEQQQDEEEEIRYIAERRKIAATRASEETARCTQYLIPRTVETMHNRHTDIRESTS